MLAQQSCLPQLNGNILRGEIYFIKLEPRSGSEQQGVRPCVIISSNAFNKVSQWKSLTVVPITSSERWLKKSRTTVILTSGEANLPKESAALAHQITTIDRGKLVGQAIGRLSQDKLNELEKATLNYLEINC